jgi:hypothetical protein
MYLQTYALHPTVTYRDSCIHSGVAQIHLCSHTRTSHHAARNTTVHRDCHDHSGLQAQEKPCHKATPITVTSAKRELIPFYHRVHKYLLLNSILRQMNSTYTVIPSLRSISILSLNQCPHIQLLYFIESLRIEFCMYLRTPHVCYTSANHILFDSITLTVLGENCIQRT